MDSLRDKTLLKMPAMLMNSRIEIEVWPLRKVRNLWSLMDFYRRLRVTKGVDLLVTWIIVTVHTGLYCVEANKGSPVLCLSLLC